MSIRLDVHGRAPAARASSWLRAAGTSLAALLLIAAAGCGHKAAQSSTTRAETPPEASSKATTTTVSTHPESAPAPAGHATKATPTAAHAEAMPSPGGNRVLLTDKGCVQLEPTWRSVRIGQSLEWRSTMGSTVTIHVSSGAFDKSVFVVRPGAIVSSGPARSAGTFSVWTEPVACQGAPRGVQGSGPGVIVKGPAEH